MTWDLRPGTWDLDIAKELTHDCPHSGVFDKVRNGFGGPGFDIDALQVYAVDASQNHIVDQDHVFCELVVILDLLSRLQLRVSFGARRTESYCMARTLIYGQGWNGATCLVSHYRCRDKLKGAIGPLLGGRGHSTKVVVYCADM